MQRVLRILAAGAGAAMVAALLAPVPIAGAHTGSDDGHGHDLGWVFASTHGHDDAGCGPAFQPCRTIGQAVTNAARAARSRCCPAPTTRW